MRNKKDYGKEIYDYILEYVKTNLYAPSYDEIAEKLGCSKTTVFNHLNELNKKGLIKISEGRQARTITLTGYRLVKNKSKKIKGIGYEKK